MSTLTQMSMQREQMQIASDNMNETVNLTAHARSILKKMWVALWKVISPTQELTPRCFLILLSIGVTVFSKTSWHSIAWLPSSFSWMDLSFVAFGESIITIRIHGWDDFLVKVRNNKQQRQSVAVIVETFYARINCLHGPSKECRCIWAWLYQQLLCRN